MLRRGFVALALALLAVFGQTAQAQEGKGLVGKWLLVGTLPSLPVGQDSVLGMIEIKGEGDAQKGEWAKEGIEPFKDSKVVDFQRKGGEVSFRLEGNVPLALKFVGADKVNGRVAGALKLNSNWFPATLTFSPKGEVPEKEKLAQETPGSDAIKQLMEKTSLEEKTKIAEKILKDHPASASAIKAGTLVADFALKDAKQEEVIKAVEFQEKSLEGLPEVLVQRSLLPTLGAIGRKNVAKEKGLALLRKVRGDGKNPTEEDLALMKLEANLLEGVDDKKSGELKSAIVKKEEELDQVFLKDAVPFKPEVFDGAKRKSKEAVVLELFTGAQCPPCVAADVAFDALAETFKAKDVVLLQYHLHIPGPDPLTNRDSENRAKFYGIRSTPTVLINGKTGGAVGGPKNYAKKRYEEVRKELVKELETPGDSSLELAAAKVGDGFELVAKYSRVSEPDKTVLRFVIVEDVARYQGRNGQRLHHHVVRAFPGGLNGQGVEQGTGSLKASFDVKDLKAQLEAYLESSNSQRPYLDAERPLELKKLKAVAFLQNAETKEITNAAQIDLELPKAPK